MLENEVPHSISSERGDALQRIWLEEPIGRQKRCLRDLESNTNFAMNRVGNYMGENRVVVVAAGDFVELYPSHYT